MFKRFVALCVTMPLFLSACSEEKTTDKTYVVATSADYAPYEFFKDNKIVGFDIDLIEAVASKIGIKIEIKDMNFDGILGSLQSKRIDMAISALTPTIERKRAADFSTQYFSTSNVLVCSDYSPVRALPDLTGMIVGVQSGSVYEIYANNELRTSIDRLEVKSLPRIPDLIQELKSRRISCLVVGVQEGVSMLKSQEGLRLVTIESAEKSGFAIALPKDSPLTEKVNVALEELKNDGTIQKLYDKWFKE